jgi:hypothetical protein
MNRKVPTHVVVTRCRIENVAHCDDETIHRMVEFLNSSQKKRRGREYFVFTGTPNGTAVPVWQAVKPGSKTARRLAFFEREIHKAGKSPKGRQALFLGAQFAQLIDELRYSHLVGARYLQKAGGAKRNSHNSNERLFRCYVWKCRQEHLDLTWKAFRESVIKPRIPELKKSNNKNLRMVGKKLIGESGTFSDGVVSEKTLQRACNFVERNLKNLTPYFSF